MSDKPLQITFSWKAALPNLSSVDQLVFFTGVILTLCGMEMSAIHAKDVINPQKNYPKAILLSVLIIIGMSIFGVLSVAIVIPQSQINLASGSLQAFSYFVDAYNLHWLTPTMAGLIAVGALGSISTWTVGPSKGLLAAASSGDLPPSFRKVNAHGMPVNLLIIQAAIVSAISLLFLLMPSVSSAYWIISVITTQLYLIMYILMFAAAIKLRYKKPDVERSYKIPGGTMGMWVVASLGILASLFAFIIGFFPPAQIPTGNVFFYVGFLLLGVIVSCLCPYLILLMKKESWKHPLPHEK